MIYPHFQDLPCPTRGDPTETGPGLRQDKGAVCFFGHRLRPGLLRLACTPGVYPGPALGARPPCLTSPLPPRSQRTPVPVGGVTATALTLDARPRPRSLGWFTVGSKHHYANYLPGPHPTSMRSYIFIIHSEVKYTGGPLTICSLFTLTCPGAI